MDHVVTYTAERPPRRIDIDSVLDSIADQVLQDGDVEKALQRSFRFGTEDDLGLLDVLEHLREQIDDVEHSLQDPDQHQLHSDPEPSSSNTKDLEKMRDALRQIESLDDLGGLDPELMNRTLSREEQEWIEKWADMTGQLIEAGLVAESGAKLVLTAKAIRQIGSKLLQHLYLPPTQRGRGSHHLPVPGTFGMPGDESSKWEWGKPFDLNIGRSITNAIRRQGPGSIRLTLQDFEVHERESGAAIHTVLLTDMSRSMFESGAWDAAKRAAVALNALMHTSQAADTLDLVGFSGDARPLRLAELPQLTWDQFSHGTNLHAGLIVAARLLQRQHAQNRQVVIITDGEPTAFMDGDNPVFEHPVTDRTIESTLLEAKRLSRRGVAITTVCVGDMAGEAGFAHTMTKAVDGRLILLPLDELGSFVVKDVAKGSVTNVM